jgi:hypothetical protein
VDVDLIELMDENAVRLIKIKATLVLDELEKRLNPMT